VLLTEQDGRPESGLLNLGSLAAKALACTAKSPSAESMKLISQLDQFCCRSAFGPIPCLTLGGPWPHRLEQLGSIPGSLAATTGQYQMDRGAQPKTVDRYIVASGLAS